MKPFLKWAGGKSWLLPKITEITKTLDFNNYHEPFLGGGSVYFRIGKKGKTYLSDVNADLINTYKTVKSNVEGVIFILNTFQNSKEDYYKIRSRASLTKEHQAARFIYLNKTSFNGIYRVNLKGEYNVPYGYRSQSIFDPDHLRAVSRQLKGSYLRKGHFEYGLKYIKENDLIFLDPPYTITHNDNGFIKYNEKIFSKADQFRLSIFIDEIIKKGAHYILTNAAHYEIRTIFPQSEPETVSRASSVGGKDAVRCHYNEFIFTNIPQ